MQRSAKRRLLLGAFVVIVVIAGGAAIHFYTPRRPEPIIVTTLEPLAQNRFWPAPAFRESDPHPLAIGWLGGPAARPFFVLFDDGRWFRKSGEDTYATGVFASNELRRMHARLRATRLVTVPPSIKLNPNVVDADGAGFCVEHSERWVCVYIDDFVAMRTREEHEAGFGARDGGPYSIVLPNGSEVPRPRYDRPVPEPILAINEVIMNVDASASTEHRGPVPGVRSIEAVHDAFIEHCFVVRTEEL